MFNFVLFLATTLSAFNHPEIEWKSVATRNFIINYYDKTEPAVYAVWKIAEEAYGTLAELYDYRPHEKIALSLAEYDDYSNGYAEWTSASIMIWLPDSRFDLRSNTTWLRNVITHELTHIISLENKKRRQMIDIGVALSCETPDEEYSFSTAIPRITTYPMWLSEGIAQFETARLGNDCFDSRREMLLRCAVRSHSQLSIDEMGSFNHDRIGSELVYNQGFAFTRYIAGKVGIGKLQALFRKGASDQTGFLRLFSETTGHTLDELYRTWIDSLSADYSRRFLSGDEPFIFRYAGGRFNLRPELSPDGAWWAWQSSGNDDGNRTDLLIAPYGSGKPQKRIPYAHTAHCFSAASDRIYYVKSRTPDNSGSYFNDIFYRQLPRGREQRLTRQGRIYDIAAIPGSSNLLCVAYREGVFGLFTCNTTTGFLTELLPGEAGSPIVNVSVNPADPATIVLSKIIDGRSRLFLLNRDIKELQPLSSGEAQEESPFWAADGRIYFSADYDGIFNIYSLLPDGSDLQRHTTTSGGFFSPKAGKSGSLVASHYSAEGFSLVTISPKTESYSVPQKEHCTFKPLPVPKGKVTIKDHPYRATYRRGVSELLLAGLLDRNSSLLTGNYTAPYDTGNLTVIGGIARYQSDALHKKERMLQLQLGALAVFGEEHSPQYFNHFSSASSLSPEKSPFMQKAVDRRMLSSVNQPHVHLPTHSLKSPSHTIAQESESESSDTTETPTFVVAAIPAFAVENRTAAPTFGIEMSSVLAMMLAPQLISLSPYMEYQFAREWTGGIRLDLSSMPFNGFPLFGTLPLYLQWVRPGIYNEDIGYNLADLLLFEISAAPQFIPSIAEGTDITTDDPYDTLIVGGFSAEISLFYGIPLFKYASLQLLSYTAASYHEKRTLDDMLIGGSNEESFLPGLSNAYVASINEIKAVFPLFRTINHGKIFYFDALYGHIGYQLFSYANSSFFDHSGDFLPGVLTDADYRPESIFLEHTVSAGFTLGQYFSFLFFRELSFDFRYYILDNGFSLSLTSGF